MKLRTFPSILLMIATLACGLLYNLSNLRASPPLPIVTISHPCESNEHWTWLAGGEAPDLSVRQEFEDSLASSGSKVRGFSEGLALRMGSTRSGDQAFAEYWISRMLLSSGLVHLAEKGFRALLMRTPEPRAATATTAIQFATISCLTSIHRQYRAIPLPEQVARKNEEDFKLLEASLSSGKPHTPALTQAFQQELFKTYAESLMMLRARSAYAAGRYSDAIQLYQGIPASSNERVHSLSELSWAFLMSEKYRESIGTAIGLQSGIFRKTYAPESFMVMAIALNEMCRFPESMNAIKSFKRSYRNTYFWLNYWQKQSKQTPKSEDLYHAAIAFAKRAPESKVPTQIGSEWIRSPIFLANQERLNLTFKESDLTQQLGQQGKAEQRTLTLKLLTEARELRPKFKSEKHKKEVSQSALSTLRTQVRAFKSKLEHLRRIQVAGPIWRLILRNYQQRVPEIKLAMIDGIIEEITRINERMIGQLEEIAENNELIEIEILNGASEDIIWQNAHPDFKELADKLKHSDSGSAAAQVWNWGTTTGGLEGRSEIWEDEIGSLSADLTDNCESKDRYLQVQLDTQGGGK